MAARTMMIEITIINSSNVNPAIFALPVTVLLSIQSCIFRIRPNVKNILPAPRVTTRRIVSRAELPIGLTGHRIDRHSAQINLLLSGQLATVGCIHALLPASAGRVSRYHIDAIDERVQIRRKPIGIIDAKDRAIADHYLAARIDEHTLLNLRLLLRRQRGPGA